MNKKIKLIYLIIVAGLFIIAFSVMFYLFNWSLKKSIIISGGAAVAMVIADLMAINFAQKKRKNISKNDTHLNNTP